MATTPTRKKTAKAGGAVTLAIDVGGTGLKVLLLDAKGTAISERRRIETPRPATPESIIKGIESLVSGLDGGSKTFHRASVGFPGVVVDGSTKSAPNLDDGWRGFPLARTLSTKLGVPVRVLNDAGVQGYGAIEGQGLEMVLTLGTGMGAALYIDGRYVPNLELAHHPFNGKKTYEQYVGGRALEKVGKKTWNKRVRRVIEQIDPIFNPRRIYLGGGNTKHLALPLPKHVSITPNVAGLLGGIALWRE